MSRQRRHVPEPESQPIDVTVQLKVPYFGKEALLFFRTVFLARFTCEDALLMYLTGGTIL